MPAVAETSTASPQEWTVTSTGGRLRRGGGRPRVTKLETDVREMLKAKMPGMVQALVEQAFKGNVRAIELALAYVVGKPTDKVELSGPDGGPIESRNVVRDDHEARLLRQAIDRELSRRAGDRAATGDQAEPAVAGAGTSGTTGAAR